MIMLGDWADGADGAVWADGAVDPEAVGLARLMRDFEIGDEALEGKTILLAYYSYADYSGSAFVLYADNETGALYEINAGHCSCYGLEGQWDDAEETSILALKHRLDVGTLGTESEYVPGQVERVSRNLYATELRMVLGLLALEGMDQLNRAMAL